MLIATDRILIPLLRLGVIPDLVVSIDGDHEVIARFVDDPMVDQHGAKLRVAMASMGAPPVAERFARAGATLYWFHPLFDDPRRQGALTALQRGMTRNARWPQGLPPSRAVVMRGPRAGCWRMRSSSGAPSGSSASTSATPWMSRWRRRSATP